MREDLRQHGIKWLGIAQCNEVNKEDSAEVAELEETRPHAFELTEGWSPLRINANHGGAN